ncbi:MAG: hypothetical protein N3G74_01240 [Candidatus Micrarchaeota archaeon]|nr:hypothetical protein [Candidatus Micrarchaeota archaeon]
MAKICVIGKEEIKGSNYKPIRDDVVISSIRKIKRFFKVAAENELVVCDKHLEEAVKRRKEFESSIVKIVAVTAVIAVIAIILALLNNSLNFIPATISMVILLFILLLFVSLFRYFPSVDHNVEQKKVITSKRRQITKRR